MKGSNPSIIPPIAGAARLAELGEAGGADKNLK